MYKVEEDLECSSKTKQKLLKAVFDGRIDIVRTLLDQGAEVETTDESGASLLHIASAKGQLAIIELALLKFKWVSMLN